jgi:hypothetical protein
MPRARRLASTVVVAALAVSGLAACNQAPDVAVYIGDKKAVTEETVQRVWDDASAKLVADETGKKALKFDRQQIVTQEVTVAALSALGKQQGFTPSAVPVDQVAAAVGLEPSAEFAKLYADAAGWRTAALQNAKPVQATDADLRDIFNRLAAAGATQGTYEQFAQQLTADQQQQLGASLGLRNELAAESKSLGIKINPRYQAPVVSLLSAQGSTSTVSLIDVTLGTGAGAAPVEDLG